VAASKRRNGGEGTTEAEFTYHNCELLKLRSVNYCTVLIDFCAFHGDFNRICLFGLFNAWEGRCRHWEFVSSGSGRQCRCKAAGVCMQHALGTSACWSAERRHEMNKM
jgi:hypothetical protein